MTAALINAASQPLLLRGLTLSPQACSWECAHVYGFSPVKPGHLHILVATAGLLVLAQPAAHLLSILPVPLPQVSRPSRAHTPRGVRAPPGGADGTLSQVGAPVSLALRGGSLEAGEV